MPFSIQNLIAAVTISFITMANWHPCAAGQQASGIDAGRMQGVSSVSSFNPLRTSPSVGLRAVQAEAQVEWSKQSPSEPVADSMTSSLSTRLAENPIEDLDGSFFGQDQPPVVVVWMNSDLHNALVSEQQLKQWMHSGRGQEDLQPAARIDTWQANLGGQVHPASFMSTEAGAPVLTRFEEQVKEFDERLAAIRKQYETKKKQLDDELGEGDGGEEEAKNLSKQALDWIGRASSGLEELKAKIKEEEGFEKKLEDQKDSLAAEKKRKAESFQSDLGDSFDQLQEKLKRRQATLQVSADKRSEIRERISARDQRVTELPSLLREKAKEENDIKKLIAELHAKAEDNLSRSFEKLLLEANLLSLEITERSLELEGRRQEHFGRIWPLELEEVTLEIKRLGAELDELSKRSDKLRGQEIQKREDAARKILKDLNENLTQSTPMLKELAEFNVGLVSDKKELARKSDALENELRNVRRLQEELDESHERIKKQIVTLGPTASGIRLVEHRRSLISTGKSQNRLLELAEQMQAKLTRKLSLKERNDQLILGDDFRLGVLAEVEKQVEEELNKQVAAPGATIDEKKQREMAVNLADQLLETQKKYSTDLLKVFENYVSLLTQLDSAHTELIDKVQEVRAFSDKNALWIRSAKPIELNDFSRCQAGLRSVLVSDQWGKLTNQASENFGKHPYHAGLLALVIGSLLVVRRRLRWSHE